MGFDWPFSPLWLGLGTLVFILALVFHARSLFQATLPRLAWKLVFLRALAGLVFLLLIIRPFLETDEPDPSEFRMLALAISGFVSQCASRSIARKGKELNRFCDAFYGEQGYDEASATRLFEFFRDQPHHPLGYPMPSTDAMTNFLGKSF